MFEIYPNGDNHHLVVEDLEIGQIVPLKEMPMAWFIKVDNSIRDIYPETYEQLIKTHGGMKTDIQKRVRQFLTCNFSGKDCIPDIDDEFNFKIEHVFCPARNTGICNHTFCNPKITSELTKCEKAVLNLFCLGLSEDEIAEKLFVSPYTIHNHINNMYAKTGIKGKSAPDRKLMAYAHHKNLI